MIPTRSGYRSVIFDLDGTLADTLSTIAGVVNQALKQLGQPGYAIDDYRTMVGDGIVKLCERALPATADVPLQEFVQVVRSVYEQQRSEQAKLFPGVAKLLQELTALGAKLGVLSNKPHDLTLGTLEDLKALHFFQCVLGQQVEFPPQARSDRRPMGCQRTGSTP